MTRLSTANSDPQAQGEPAYRRLEMYSDEVTADVAGHVHGMLEALGEDPHRHGLQATPDRVAKAYQYLLQGYRQDARAILEGAIFKEDYSEMIVVKGIEVFSLCEHHLLPFLGKAHVAYIPQGRIVGLSKIPRVVDAFARRLQLQERLTIQIRDTLQDVINPLGVGVVIEASHLCLVMRGVQKQHSMMVTSAMSGEFLDNATTRAEFMRLINGA